MGGKSSPAAATPAPPPVVNWAEIMSSMTPMEMPAVSAPSYDGPSIEEQQAEQQKQQGIADRDSAYTSYMDAASSATDYVNSELDKEEANARLRGTNFVVTDDMKQQRTNDYFATIWGEGQQTQMEQLFDEFGEPKGFDGYSVTRGDASTYANQTEATEETVATTGKKSGTSPLEDEEGLGGVVSPLG